MTAVDAHAFAKEWVDAWNAHDLERVLAHYADDIELISPRAAQVVPESGGVIRGKGALRAYWTTAMAGIPDLRFELDDVFTSVSGATILYRNHRGLRVTETFVWNAHGLVVRTIIAHAPPRDAAADAPPRAAADALPRTAAASDRHYCMIARVPPDGVAAFARYEAGVLPLLPEHGATLEQRLRTPDGTAEIHVVRFPDDAALAAYRADPRRAALQPELAASRASVELVAVERVPDV